MRQKKGWVSYMPAHCTCSRAEPNTAKQKAKAVEERLAGTCNRCGLAIK